VGHLSAPAARFMGDVGPLFEGAMARIARPAYFGYAAVSG
jgi:hypothetical protein